MPRSTAGATRGGWPRSPNMSGPISINELAGSVEEPYRAALAALIREDAVGRLSRRDASLWKADPGHQKTIQNRLGWLDGPAWLTGKAAELHAFAAEVRAEGFTRVLLLGMGGSSLAPQVLAEVMRPAPGAPTLEVLDSTDPAAIRNAEASHRLDRTFFLVSSKSGRTIETLSQYRYFRARLEEMRVDSIPGRFAAITDPGSALAYFGMVPAALLGLDLEAFGARAARVAKEFASPEPERNGALRLGAWLGAAARSGRDKLTILTPSSLRPIGYWIEQLIAESTGKEGRGIVPVEGEPPGFARYYSE